MLDEIYSKQKQLCEKSIDVLKKDFNTIRSGKVSVSILDNIQVTYYGQLVPINQVATVLATDATTITITPWEKSVLKDLSSAIQVANIGVNPNNDGETIKLFFPPMTTEQRESNAKKAKAMGENAKVSIRNIRKNANDDIKKLEKDKEISEDIAKKGYDEVQNITNIFISKVDTLVKDKEKELLKI